MDLYSNSVHIPKLDALAMGLKLLQRYAPKDGDQFISTDDREIVVRVRSVHEVTRTHRERLKILGFEPDGQLQGCFRWQVR